MSVLSKLEDLPDDLISRKVVLIVLTMVVILLIAVVGTVIIGLLGGDTSLLHEAMQLILGAGGIGTVSQAVPDTAQAIKGQYRPQQTVTTPTIYSPTPPAVPLITQGNGPRSMFGG